MLYKIREYIKNWRFYSGLKINTGKIRKPVYAGNKPLLDEDAGNLSAVLFNLVTEHPEAFADLKSLIHNRVW